MGEDMVFAMDADNMIRAGGFLVRKPSSAPLSTLPDGLAIPAGLYALHREMEGQPSQLAVEPANEVVEESICAILMKKLSEAQAQGRTSRRTTRRTTKRRKPKRPKKNTRSKGTK